MDWNRLALAVQMLGSLVLILLVLVVTYYASRWYAQRMKGSVSGKYIKIIDRTVLGAGSSLIIAKVGEKYYLLGASEKNLQLLCELDAFDPGAVQPETAQVAFGSLLRELMQKTGRFGGGKGDGGEQ